MDVRDVVTWIINPRLNRAVELLMEEGRRRSEAAGPGDDAWLEWSEWLRLAALLRKWRDWLARQRVWNARLCREALDKLAPIMLRMKGLGGSEEAFRLLFGMVEELEASVGLKGYFEDILAKLGKARDEEIFSPDIELKRLDVHYMVTRIINPQINPLISMLRESRGIAGRDGYTRVRWRMFSDSDYIASLLEIWVDDIWRKYKDEDLAERGGELLDSLLEVTAEAEARLGEGMPVAVLWELARELERYLGLDGYTEAARQHYKALVERKREERRRIAEALRRASRRRRFFARRSSYDVVTTKRGVTKKVVIITVVIAALLLLLFLGPSLLGLGRITVIPLQLLNSSVQAPLQCGSGRYYSLPRALYCYLSEPEEVLLLRRFAERLKGSNLTQSAWKVLEWEDNNIRYDWMRHNVPGEIQPPSVTVNRKQGVSADYAVLTAGILLYMGYPAYVFNISFYGTERSHVTAAVKIDGKYYMLDQHLPPMSLWAYYNYWAYSREGVYEGHRLESLRIREARVYRVYLSGGRVQVEDVGVLSTSQFRSGSRHDTKEALEELAERLALLMRERHPNLVVDPGVGRSPWAARWEFEFPVLAEAYSPVFADKYVEWLYGEMAGSARFAADLARYRRLWVECRAVGDSLVVDVYLASP